MCLQFVSFLVTHNHQILAAVNFDTMLQLNHFPDVFQQSIGEILIIFGDEISSVVFDVGRDSFRIIATI